ncbi:tRNA (N(6)-L-threonylcarbamoyladenosine(37)-C(2))-methylthiotransferase MtaB [Oscillibacter sp. MSJ-2]|uniref:tRNA (N(6)-L-threonylcarbamoyladenosine(37)-C(2))-methylthiotransferase MtaB n=1 Tax=Dysosmobacter acutus TaxID=2841504 RepID=A0ABS6FD93_9FIRM|nr:tRNA (N(6)-L-threonylcarbamoyladenosine(37)-C(2))-methylthiotransferase MtaB [Dysosmobacter acutus]MBU5628122.1 tRNA (N(6)-L-threonylcarbamoyladenosine(37)-C(2))-methylthiotransferase MtaB [Dysosmobacter acutus]
MKVAIYTLGCKVNQYETQAMEQELRRRGHTVVPFAADADAYVVNTCSVTAVSDQKSRQVVSRARRTHPESVVAICGCYAQTHPEDVRALPVDLIAGTGDRMGFLDLLEQEMEDRRPMESLDRSFERRTFELLSAGGLPNRTRAMLKVEDGCVNFCSYCIIPYARGPVRSLTLEDAAREAARLQEEGYREIVLTGIEISSWGQDLKNGKSLIDLIETVCTAAPECRVRLGSLEPRTITEEFCRRAVRLENLCPQFHLSLQSGCDDTLRRMNRKYDTARYAESAELLRRFFRRPALTTDLIVGFPEETEEEFARTMAFIRSCGFAQMHIFPYSIRPGTPAAARPQVSARVKETRAAAAAEAAGQMHREYLAGCVGERYPVLFEQEKNGRFAGHAPNYMEVFAKGADLHNKVRMVRVTGVEEEGLTGEIEE